MKRSAINLAYRQASACFEKHSWVLPPQPQWDITDFGLGDFSRHGLTLINLAAEPEYCEKLMYARRDQRTPCHTHAKKKEDIICRAGELTLWLWSAKPSNEHASATSPTSTHPANVSSPASLSTTVTVAVNGRSTTLPAGKPFVLSAGHRITLVPGIWHAFAPSSDECIIGEVSTTNDDLNDNFFVNSDIGRFPGIEEDAPAEIRLLSE